MKWGRVLLYCGSILAATACSPRHPTGSAAEFRELIVARNSAAANADTAALRPMLADDLIWVIGATSDAVGKAKLLAAAGTPQDPKPRFSVDSVRVNEIGRAAIVDYRRTDHRRVGTYEDSVAWRVFEVFERSGGRWLLARHDQAWLRQPMPAPLPIDSATLAPFVGHYEIAPGYTDNVHFEGPELVATATGETEGAHLLPVTRSAFLPDGVGQLLVFERDSKGQVLGYVQGYPDGRVIRARKVD